MNGQINRPNNKCENYSEDVPVKCVDSSFSEYFSSLGGLDCYFDFDEGFECSKIIKKPCLVYFSGHSSIESRKMELELFSNAKIIETIKGNFIFVNLTKDDKLELSPFYQVVSLHSGDTITTYGKKCIYYQKRLSTWQKTKHIYIWLIISI